MNAKTTAGIISIVTVLCGTIYAYKVYNSQHETTTRNECFSGSIDACVTLDKQNKQLYKVLEDTQQQLAESNKAIKQQASKLLSGSSFQ